MTKKYFSTPEAVFEAVLGPPQRTVTLEFPVLRLAYAYRMRLYRARETLRRGLSASLDPLDPRYGASPWDGVVVNMISDKADTETTLVIHVAAVVAGTVEGDD